MQQRQHDGEGDTFLDRQQHDQGDRRHHEQDFARTPARDPHHLARPDDAKGDVDQNGIQGRARHESGGGSRETGQQDDDGNGQELRHLGTAPRLDNDGRAGWAGIDREGTGHARQQAAGADTDEIPADILGDARRRWKRTRHRGGLHHADQGDRHGERQQVGKVLESQGRHDNRRNRRG